MDGGDLQPGLPCLRLVCPRHVLATADLFAVTDADGKAKLAEEDHYLQGLGLCWLPTGIHGHTACAAGWAGPAGDLVSPSDACHLPFIHTEQVADVA